MTEAAEPMPSDPEGRAHARWCRRGGIRANLVAGEPRCRALHDTREGSGPLERPLDASEILRGLLREEACETPDRARARQRRAQRALLELLRELARDPSVIWRRYQSSIRDDVVSVTAYEVVARQGSDDPFAVGSPGRSRSLLRTILVRQAWEAIRKERGDPPPQAPRTERAAARRPRRPGGRERVRREDAPDPWTPDAFRVFVRAIVGPYLRRPTRHGPDSADRQSVSEARRAWAEARAVLTGADRQRLAGVHEGMGPHARRDLMNALNVRQWRFRMGLATKVRQLLEWRRIDPGLAESFEHFIEAMQERRSPRRGQPA